jgi:hypothetical protein
MPPVYWDCFEFLSLVIERAMFRWPFLCDLAAESHTLVKTCSGAASVQEPELSGEFPLGERLFSTRVMAATWSTSQRGVDDMSDYQTSGSGSRGGTSGLGITSMVLGILWLYWVGSILAVIFGHVALSQIKKDPSIGGRGIAVAGVVLGWIGVGILLLSIVLGIGLMAAES